MQTTKDLEPLCRSRIIRLTPAHTALPGTSSRRLQTLVISLRFPRWWNCNDRVKKNELLKNYVLTRRMQKRSRMSCLSRA